MTAAIRTGPAIALLALALAGCSADSAPPVVIPTIAAVPTVTFPSASSAATSGLPDLTAPETVATGLTTPWGLAFLPDGSTLVSQRDNGRIMQVRPGGGAPREVYRVPGVVHQGEGGLLGLAVAKDFASTSLVYAYYTSNADNRIARFTLNNPTPQVIFTGIDKAGNHNGGRIAFGPDGMLYAGTGDAGTGSAAQDPNDTNGKILRLTPDGKPAPGNPFPGSPVWSLGHRNVQGLAWDGNGTMYGIEFGQNTWDEVNVIQPGKNYGWPVVEGKADNSKYTNPIVQWRTADASPSGAAIAGRTLYVAALKGQRLWTVPLDGGATKAELSGRYGRLRTVAVAPDGALWLTTSNTDGRGSPKDGDDRILRFPAG